MKKTHSPCQQENTLEGQLYKGGWSIYQNSLDILIDESKYYDYEHNFEKVLVVCVVGVGAGNTLLNK